VPWVLTRVRNLVISSVAAKLARHVGDNALPGSAAPEGPSAPPGEAPGTAAWADWTPTSASAGGAAGSPPRQL